MELTSFNYICLVFAIIYFMIAVWLYFNMVPKTREIINRTQKELIEGKIKDVKYSSYKFLLFRISGEIIFFTYSLLWPITMILFIPGAVLNRDGK